MKLEGSCSCKAVSFSLDSAHPYPFNICYCSICRKTAGGGGFAINLGGDAESLVVNGGESVSIYRASIADSETGKVEQSPCERHFCKVCATVLWVWDPRWPELIHPFASAIDSDLPTPTERTHLMLEAKSSWIEPQFGELDRRFDVYPQESIAEWHQRLGVEVDPG